MTEYKLVLNKFDLRHQKANQRFEQLFKIASEAQQSWFLQ